MTRLLRRAARLVLRLAGHTRGNVAMIGAFAFLGLIVVGGGAIDLQRASAARGEAQDVIDLAGVAAASTRHTDTASLERAARDFLAANEDLTILEPDPDIVIRITDISRLDIALTGSVRTIFMGLVGIPSLPVEVTTAVERGAVDRVELALVLDNTWSMSADDGTGVTKINALKSAARNLVDALMTRQDGSIKVGVVPYADYVNVGLANRNAAWITGTTDYATTTTTPAKDKECKKSTAGKRTCTKGTPKTCTSDKDGVITTYDCTPNVCTTATVPEYETCTAATKETSKTTWTRWYGCIGSRREGKSRLDDVPGKLYPGMMTNSGKQNCLTEITPLTDRKQTVTDALSAMVVNVGDYQPLTYIPGGLIWGVNTLSPTAPLTEAAPYQESGRDPRKIMVLMTDGENYMRFVSGSGAHAGPATAAQKTATNADTLAICTYAKSKGIEIYTVALAVDSDTARQLLEDCATDTAHYFDAQNAQTLARAFADIAASIYRVRIVE